MIGQVNVGETMEVGEGVRACLHLSSDTTGSVNNKYYSTYVGRATSWKGQLRHFVTCAGYRFLLMRGHARGADVNSHRSHSRRLMPNHLRILLDL
jgi:hypothetical protein